MTKFKKYKKISPLPKCENTDCSRNKKQAPYNCVLYYWHDEVKMCFDFKSKSISIRRVKI